MKLTFIGADHEVTGSCHMVEVGGRSLLVDCGMEQGEDCFVNASLPIPVSKIEAVVLTHAHMDHSGLLPLLYKNGFRGPIYATEPTTMLCNIMLRDSAHIQEQEATWKTKKALRKNEPPVEPIYKMQDAVEVMDQFVSIPYEKDQEVFPGVKFFFRDAGHLLGSAGVQMTLTEAGVEKTVVFSGDIGNKEQPLIRNPGYFDHADVVLTETTYGDRLHGKRPDFVRELTRILKDTFRRGGNLVVPCFAVGRTQEMLYILREIKEQNLLPEYPDFPVYVDSPLAVEATTVFEETSPEYFDEEAREMLQKRKNPIAFPKLYLSITTEDSMALNENPTPKVILSASGMCEAGRIRHHLKHNLWRADSTVLFVGFQARGTLGRTILEGADKVKIFGEEIAVHAKIESLHAISGHADRDGLLEWMRAFHPVPGKVFLVHGEDEIMQIYADRLKEEFGIEAELPYSGSVYNLLTDAYDYKAERKELCQREPGRAEERRTIGELLDRGQELMQLMRRLEGHSNKELRSFTKDVEALLDKYKIEENGEKDE